jgi:hypothetical protein
LARGVDGGEWEAMSTSHGVTSRIVTRAESAKPITTAPSTAATEALRPNAG